MARPGPTDTAPTSIAVVAAAPPTSLAALGQRIVVLGVTGSGKSTLAAELARRVGAPHIELDALNWEPNWTPAERDVFRARVAQATAGDAWVVDGNYRETRDFYWPRAEAFVWLDYPLPIIYARLLRRILWRGLARAELWSGNRERIWPHFFTRDSLFVWAFTSQPKHRRDYPQIPDAYADACFIHLRSPRATARWLAGLR